MKLSDFATVQDLVGRRQVLVEQINAIGRESVHVTIGGIIACQEIVDVVLPDVAGTLHRLMTDIDSQLLKLGVRLS